MDNASLYSQAQPGAFGAELKDQIPAINQHLVNGISFLNEFRDFCKERANIERDYAHKIEALVRKYQHKKEKKTANTLNGGVPASPLEPDFDPALYDGTTTSRAWTSILNDTEALSRDRHQFSENLISKVYDPLKVLATKKDEARKKHVLFAQKLLAEREKSTQERDKAKAKYDTSCEEVENSKQKQERAFDEKNQEKLKRSYYQDILDMNNNKNSYVLTLQVLNTHRKKYYDQDIPELSNNMQALDESRIEGLKEVWEGYIRLEAKLNTDAQSHQDSMMQAVQGVDASIDSAIFVRTHRTPWSAPLDLPFESSPTFNDTEELVLDDNASVFLSNKLMKLRRKHAQTTVDINSRLKDMEGLSNLKNAYIENSSLGDPEEVQESILEASRAITVLQTMSALYDAEINTIVQTIGDTGVQNQPHDFKAASFTIPTSCDYCQSTIWGIAKQGFTCRDCGFNCHSKCEMKVPPTCSNVKGGAKAQRNSFLGGGPLSATSPTSTYSTLSSLPAELAPAGTPISELKHRASLRQSPSSSGAPAGAGAGAADAARSPQSIKRGAPQAGSHGSLNQLQAHVIYDYDASSPGELTVRVGDVVTILEGDDDGSGWVTGQVNGSSGLIPLSYIEMEQFHEALSEVAPIQKVRVLYDYDAQSNFELTIREGDTVVLTSTDCSEGWWEGTLRGVTAQFPANYVELI
ncbi:hypothetical protein BGZ96_007999 [Linnemannia gamsii]|uniref:FCH-domain-containing protein n=1 Tax=Linnemannia gamsii TaxID=64522 RepID=A0ABQ7KDK5_9FUNG|nr:hypothetical protein BGZ96_007999 [Linnemannia gamsii]